MPASPPVAAPRAAPSRLRASAVMGTASAVGEEVAVAAVKARQLGLACCFACRAASVKTMAMAKAKAKFAAPPGAGKVDDGSGALLRSSSSATLSDRLVGLLDAPPGPSCSPPPMGPTRSPPPWGRQRRRRIRRLLHLRTSVRTSSQLRVIASRSDSILTNAAREANIYYVAHVDYILYIGGLKPKGERVIFVSLPWGASAPGWRATSLRPIVVMVGQIYILPPSPCL